MELGPGRRRPIAWLVVGMLLAWLQFDAMRGAFERLGLSPSGALAVLSGCMLGSAVNLPVAQVRAGGTVVALNVGGCIVPVALASWLAFGRLDTFEVLCATAGVAVASRCFSRVEPGVGVTMSIFVAPLSALLFSVLVGSGELAALAYVSATLGVLIGADLLRLHEASRSGAPVLAIGGAGTRDGIFVAGVLAVLLA